MIFPAPMRSGCAVSACSGGMGPETNSRPLARINWWNRVSIWLGRCFRWSMASNPPPKACPGEGAESRSPGYALKQVSAFGLQRLRKMPLQHRGGDGIGLLQIDAPIFQFVERNPFVGDRAAHIAARGNHTKVAVQILHLRFAMAG